MKNTGALRETVTRSWFGWPDTTAGITEMALAASAGSKALRLASSTARSVASLREPRGTADAEENWSGMKTTPESAAAAAARSAAMLYM